MLPFLFSRPHTAFHVGFSFQTQLRTVFRPFSSSLIWLYFEYHARRGSGETLPTSSVCLIAWSNHNWPCDLHLPDHDGLSLSCLPQLTILSQCQPSQPQSSQSCLHTQFGTAQRSILHLSAAQRHLKYLLSCMQRQWVILSHCEVIWYWGTSPGTKFCHFHQEA